MSKILIKLDAEKDAWNWWHACNKVSHGVDWKTKISADIQKRIVSKSQKQAYSFLLPYLNQLHKQNSLQARVRPLQNGFNKKQAALFATMEKLTKHKIYRNNFTCFLTTFPRFPYDYEKGYIWISSKHNLDFQLSIFIHELLHFQFFTYYGEKVWDAIGPEKYQYLKEAMTVILNQEFKNVTSVKDQGYEIHKNLRQKFLKIWQQTKDMDLFIDSAIKTAKTLKVRESC